MSIDVVYWNNALIEAKVKGQERTLSDYLPGCADSRRRLDEISCKYNLSPEEQKYSDDLNRRTAESVELARKHDYFIKVRIESTCARILLRKTVCYRLYRQRKDRCVHFAQLV
jgi:hypothetical protein